MATKNLEIFSEVCLESDSEFYSSDSESDVYFKPLPKMQYLHLYEKQLEALKPVDFEKYVQDKCENRVKLLNRLTFHQILKPIVICFNHFREKCAYHTKILDIFYELALKYGDCIEFIAADMLDIDIINRKWHSIDFFCKLVNPAKESATIFAIDQQKRIHQLHSAYKNLEILTILCEDLLKGVLFQSQPLIEQNNFNLVKLCVHSNYTELVTNAAKHILLIISWEDYSQINLDYEPNYESVARKLLAYDVDVVHINAQKNYIPFELGVSDYPTLLFIANNDKRNFVDFLNGPRNEENIVNCIKRYLEDPERFLTQLNRELNKHRYQPLNVTPNFNIDFQHLKYYLHDNCHQYLKVLEPKGLRKNKCYVIIAFMDFSSGKCTYEHLKWIDLIYQVAINLYKQIEYFIADFKDIGVINPIWKPQQFIMTNGAEDMVPKVFGIDLKKNKYALKDFKTAGSLCYFAYSLSRRELYKSERFSNIYDGKLVKTCIAENLNLCISSIKKHIFLAIYNSNIENTNEFLLSLEEIAHAMRKIPVKIIKINSHLNYIPLEMDDVTYPILYFIPKNNKNLRIRFLGNHFDKEEIKDFIMKIV